MIGKDVPQRTPANNVKKTALPFCENRRLGTLASPVCFYHTQEFWNKTFASFKRKKKEKKVLFHYGFEVFVGCLYGHDVKFLDEHAEDTGCDECG
jgi:hypothetical protein